MDCHSLLDIDSIGVHIILRMALEYRPKLLKRKPRTSPMKYEFYYYSPSQNAIVREQFQTIEGASLELQRLQKTQFGKKWYKIYTDQTLTTLGIRAIGKG